MIKKSNLFILFFLISCSSIRFKSTQNISSTFDVREFQTKKVSVKISKQFYLWGLVPGEQVVEIDKLFKAKGYDSVSSIQIYESDEVKKSIWMFITLGMYYPQSFEILAKTGT